MYQPPPSAYLQGMTKPDPERFKKLPEPIKLEDTVETADVDPHAPTNDGPLQENGWLLRTAGGA
jgi:hypothetical protein